MPDREKVIEGLKAMHDFLGIGLSSQTQVFEEDQKILEDAIALLKEQEGYVSVPFSWLVKFCTHIDFVEPLTDEVREVAWRQKLRQQFGIDASKKAVK